MDDSDEKKLEESEGQSAMKLKGDSLLKIVSTCDNIWKGASSIFIWSVVGDTVSKASAPPALFASLLIMASLTFHRGFCILRSHLGWNYGAALVQKD